MRARAARGRRPAPRRLPSRSRARENARCWSRRIPRTRWATRWKRGTPPRRGWSAGSCSRRRWMPTARSRAGSERASDRSASSPRGERTSTTRTSTPSSDSRCREWTSWSGSPSCGGFRADSTRWWWTRLPRGTRCACWPCPRRSRGSRRSSTICRPSTARWPGRSAEEARMLDQTRAIGLPLYGVPEQAREPRGPRHLGTVAQALRAPLRSQRIRKRVLPRSASAPAADQDWLEDVAGPGVRLVLFGGKGGVGKTTPAAAAAISIARRGDRVLLLSTDPAHSIGDVLGTAIGDQEREVEPRLWAFEPDAARAFERRREKYRTAVEELFAALRGGSSVDAPYDRAVMKDLIELAPPGLDELFALLAVIEALQRYPVVVADTAPTGHALRLLELVGKAREWVQVLLQIQLKYRRVTGLGELARDLTGTARELRELQQLLVDPGRARFVAVTRAAALPRQETARLLSALRRLRIATPALLVNALIPPGCSRCRRAAPAQKEGLSPLRRIGRGCAMLGAPWNSPAPRGGGALAPVSPAPTRMGRPPPPTP